MFHKKKCPNCGRKFDDQLRLNDHLAIETLERETFCKCRLKYECECCSCQTIIECFGKGHKCQCDCYKVFEKVIING